MQKVENQKKLCFFLNRKKMCGEKRSVYMHAWIIIFLLFLNNNNNNKQDTRKGIINDLKCIATHDSSGYPYCVKKYHSSYFIKLFMLFI